MFYIQWPQRYEGVKQLSRTQMKQVTVAYLVSSNQNVFFFVQFWDCVAVYSPALAHYHWLVSWLSEWTDYCRVGDYWSESKDTPGSIDTRCTCWCFSVRSQGQRVQPDWKEMRELATVRRSLQNLCRNRMLLSQLMFQWLRLCLTI